MRSLTQAVAIAAMISSLSRPSLAQESGFTPIATRAVVTLVIRGYADFLAADGEAVWVTNEGRVEQLRRNQREPVASVPIPEPCGAMTVAFGALWVANCRDRSVHRVDVKAKKVTAVIHSGLADSTGELSLADGAGSIWVLTNENGVLSRIDPQTNRVVAQIRVAPRSYAAAFGFGAVWVSNTGPPDEQGFGSVQRIDPVSNQVITTIPVGPAPRFLATGEGAVWILNQGDGTVSRIDPVNNHAVVTIALNMPGPGGDIATGGGRVWVRGKSSLLSTIDPATNQVAERFGPPTGSGAVRVAGDWVWVTAHDIHTVWVLRARLRP
jgi:virginiamycin B lyase